MIRISPLDNPNAPLTKDGWRAGLEWALVILAAPVLWFPTINARLTAGALVMAGTGLLVLSVGGGQRESLWKLAGLFRWPWAIFIVSMLAGTVVSPAPDLTLPKISGLVLGMLVFRAVLLTGTTPRAIWRLTWAHLAAGSGMIVGGAFVSPFWPSWKSHVLYAVSAQIPRLLGGLPGAEEGVNANALGGSTLLLLPLLLVLAVETMRSSGKTDARESEAHGRASAFEQVGYIAAAAALLAVLVFSQSHTAWVSAATAALIVVAIRFRATLFLGGAGATAALAAWIWSDPGSRSTMLGSDGRVFLWSLGLRALQDHPISGVGLGAFRKIQESMQVVPVNHQFRVGHAHNIFLQVALDIGIPGLIAYLALLALATVVTYQIVRGDANRGWQALCLGLWANLVAIHVFGLADAIALGSKVGVFFWWNLALVGALHRVTRLRPAAPSGRSPSAAAGGMRELFP